MVWHWVQGFHLDTWWQSGCLDCWGLCVSPWISLPGWWVTHHQTSILGRMLQMFHIIKSIRGWENCIDLSFCQGEPGGRYVDLDPSADSITDSSYRILTETLLWKTRVSNDMGKECVARWSRVWRFWNRGREWLDGTQGESCRESDLTEPVIQKCGRQESRQVRNREPVSMKEREEFQTGDHHPGRYATVGNACGESEELLWAHGEEGKLSMKTKHETQRRPVTNTRLARKQF